jgi:site-specific recombinase XerC
MGEIERAKHVLETERDAVRAGLAEERAAAERAAEEQRRWRADVQALLERGRAAGLSVAEMAEALGISRQWTNHLTKTTVGREQAAINRAVVERGASLGPGYRLGTLEFGPPPPDQP